MEDDVKAYLKAHPEFFEKHAHLLTELYLPSPHGDGAISLAQRQQLAQRDKIRVLESRFTELILNAEENDKTSEKMHALTLGLLRASSFESLNQQVIQFLESQFYLPNCQLKLWSGVSQLSDEPKRVFVEAEDALINWVKDLSQPYCGAMPTMDIAHWFVETPASLAIIPLRKRTQSFGVLVLPSQNQTRFYAGMGTLFLSRIGELVSAALTPYLK